MYAMEVDDLDVRQRIAQGYEFVDGKYFTGPFGGALEDLDGWLADRAGGGDAEPSAQAWQQVAICLMVAAIYE